MGEPHRIEDIVFSPARAFDLGSFQSGGCGMVGTAEDFMTFLEALRTGGAPILTHETVELASRNQVGILREQEDPAGVSVSFQGYLSIPSGPGRRPPREGWSGVEFTGTRGSSIRSSGSALWP